MGTMSVQGHGEEGGECEMEREGSGASSGHRGPLVTEASRWRQVWMHERGNGEGMGRMHRGIGVQEGNGARSELFSGGVGNAEEGWRSRAPKWERMSWQELLARGGR